MMRLSIQPARPVTPTHRRRDGFTLIELLVSVSIIAMLLGILLPALGSARAAGQGAVCLSNQRQLALGNTAYAQDNAGYYVLASDDIYSKNLHRWHGERNSSTSGSLEDRTFDPSRGPLARYIGNRGEVRYCPTFEGLIDFDAIGFESGCGGYGYNGAYIGGRNDVHGIGIESSRHSARADEVTDPGRTTMFTDAAFYKYALTGTRIIEYSFAEQPFREKTPGVVSDERPRPSIHFRHHDMTQIAWSDGHVGSEAMTFTNPDFEDYYRRLGFGWFGPRSNELFDLR